MFEELVVRLILLELVDIFLQRLRRRASDALVHGPRTKKAEKQVGKHETLAHDVERGRDEAACAVEAEDAQTRYNRVLLKVTCGPHILGALPCELLSLFPRPPSPTMSSTHELFGGAITVTLPSDLLDASYVV